MKLLCKDCGTFDEPRSETPGSFHIELLLWLCFLIPGLIYSIWRMNRRHDVCRACGSHHLIPHDSPVAKTIMDEHGIQPPQRRDNTKSVKAGAALGRMVGRALRKG